MAAAAQLPDDLKFLASLRPKVAYQRVVVHQDQADAASYQVWDQALLGLEKEERQLLDIYDPNNANVVSVRSKIAFVKDQIRRANKSPSWSILRVVLDFTASKDAVAAALAPQTETGVDSSGRFLLQSGSSGWLQAGKGLPNGVTCRVTIVPALRPASAA